MKEQEIRNVFEDIFKSKYPGLRCDLDEDDKYALHSLQLTWLGFYAGFQLGRESTQEPMGS